MKEKVHRLLSYTYDYLDRISLAVYNVDGAGLSNIVQYTYRASENGETGLVEKYTSIVGSSASVIPSVIKSVFD